jgi:HNH endonuclease
MTTPFEYPPAPHVRRHGPRGYSHYSRFRPWLRDEFSFRCVYCLRRERWEVVSGTFNIDHFVPVAVDSNLATDYDNLLYACASCNFAKGARALPQPLTALTAAVVHVNSDGTIHADEDSEAARLIDLLGLDSLDYIKYRKLWIAMVALARQKPNEYEQIMGYPKDLPNLRRHMPPHGLRE